MKYLNKKSILLFSLFLSLPSLAVIAAEKSAAIDALKQGNERFVSGKVRTDGQSASDIARLAGSQNPHSIVLSCSDSRVPPELVFDQKLGEIFTVRSAGESLSPTALGTIEYAVSKLGTPFLLVLGHTSCGAVKAAAESEIVKFTGSENLAALIADVQARIHGKFDPKNPSKELKAESWQNAKGVAADLLKRSPLIAKAVASGKLEIRVALYNLSTGRVEFE
jgi:carbonic anhydrase